MGPCEGVGAVQFTNNLVSSTSVTRTLVGAVGAKGVVILIFNICAKIAISTLSIVY